MTEQLKPCPFCGTQPFLEEHPPHQHGFSDFATDGSVTISCNCGVGLIADNKKEAINKWNYRLKDDQWQPINHSKDYEGLHLVQEKWGEEVMYEVWDGITANDAVNENITMIMPLSGLLPTTE